MATNEELWTERGKPIPFPDEPEMHHAWEWREVLKARVGSETVAEFLGRGDMRQGDRRKAEPGRVVLCTGDVAAAFYFAAELRRCNNLVPAHLRENVAVFLSDLAERANT